MHLGIEIGGTKLQIGVGLGNGSPVLDLRRCEVDQAAGAQGILDQIAGLAPELLQRWPIERVGIGFGGPVDYARGRAIESHSVEGWHDLAVAAWVERTFGRTAIVGQDCAISALAEARYGAGRGASSVLYVTVGTGVGGGLALDGNLYLGIGPAVAEIGQMRLGIIDPGPDVTVEAFASGPGLEAHARAHAGTDATAALWWDRSLPPESLDLDGREALLEACAARLDALSTRTVGHLAANGNGIARHVLTGAQQALGWAIAQAVTLVAPEVVVVGGGVSLLGEELFLAPLRREASRFVFPLMIDTFRVVPAELGEAVVVQGALTIAAEGRVPTYAGAPLPPLPRVGTHV